MYGAKINRLNLVAIDRDDADQETIVWTRTGNMGPDWKHAQVQFNGNNTGGNFIFSFEGKLTLSI